MIHKTISVFTYQKISIFSISIDRISVKVKWSETSISRAWFFLQKAIGHYIRLYLKNTHSLACFKKHAIETLFVICLMKMTDIWVNLSIFVNGMFMREAKKANLSVKNARWKRVCQDENWNKVWKSIVNVFNNE